MPRAAVAPVIGGLIIGTAGSIIAQTLWVIPPAYSAAGVVAFAIAGGALIAIRRRARNVRAVGVYSVATDANDKSHTPQICSAVHTAFDFFGICAFRTALDPGFRQLLENSRHKENVQFRFLLLDPASPDLPKRATEEREDPVSLRHEVEATLTRLGQYQRTFNVHIEVRLYDRLPIWRMVFIDEKTLYLNQFLTGKKGTDSPQIRIEKGSDDSLYLSFRRTFEYEWEKAKVYI
jgi:hypothetical protein